MTDVDEQLEAPAPPAGRPVSRAGPAHRRPAERRPPTARLGSARWLYYPTAVFVLSRVVVLGAVWTVLRIQPSPAHFGVLKRWDGGWYVRAAQTGYSHLVPALQGGTGDAGQSTHAFFPLLPLLLRLGHGLGASYLSTSLLLNLVAGIVASVLLG
jgi:hypothetical protein